MELFIFSLLAIISSCFIIELFLARPKFSDVILGFIPSLNSESIYIAIGIIGATGSFDSIITGNEMIHGYADHVDFGMHSDAT